MVGFAAAGTILLELAVGFGQLNWIRFVGDDYRIYMDATARWLNGGSYFLPRQLAGPYQIEMGDVMYPPVALCLFVPALVLPAVFWWAVPTTVSAAAFRRLRPPAWAVAISLVIFVYPKNLATVFDGNPGMYVFAALAAAAAWGTPASLALFKPSLFPLALVGIRSRTWWYGFAALVLLSLPLLPLTLTWLRVVLDARPGGPTYSLMDAPACAVPLLWWFSSGRRRTTAPARARVRQPRQLPRLSMRALRSPGSDPYD
jgi:hypothetical protein